MYKLTRFKQNKKATWGVLFDEEDRVLCRTLEMPWKNNFRDDIKTKNNEASCIPEGVYNVKSYSSRKYPNVWQILDVPNRTKILIHQGNFVSNETEKSDTTGCILVGDRHTERKSIPIVTNSKDTLDSLRSLLPSEFELKIECAGFSNINKFPQANKKKKEQKVKIIEDKEEEIVDEKNSIESNLFVKLIACIFGFFKR